TREGARLRPENFPHPRPGTRVHGFGHTTESTSMSVTLLLGSASTSRAAILTRAGIPFTQLAADIDETALVTDVPEPRVQAQALPTAIAHALSHMLLRYTLPDGPTYTIAADSVFEFEGHAYGKPQHPDVAIERWRAQRDIRVLGFTVGVAFEFKD